MTNAPRQHRPPSRRSAPFLGIVLGIAALFATLDANASASEPSERPRYAPVLANETSDTAGTSRSSLSWSGTVALALAALALGVGWRGRNLTGSRSSGGFDDSSGTETPLRVTERVRLTGRHHACLVRKGGRAWLIGLGGEGPPALLDHWLEDAERRNDPAVQEPDGSPTVKGHANAPALTINAASPRRSA